MAIGPLQFLVIGARTDQQQGDIAKELRTLVGKGAIRVIDLAYVTKKEDGTLTSVRASGLTDEERRRFGAVVGGLIGLGAAGVEGARTGAEMGAAAYIEKNFGLSVEEFRQQLYDVAQDMPPGTAFAIALIEHHWLVNLRDALRKNGTVILAQGLVRPASLVMFGSELAAAEQAAEQATY